MLKSRKGCLQSAKSSLTTTEYSSVQERMKLAFLFVSNQKFKMMRIIIMITLLAVCARSVAQTTVISTGEIRLAIEVYDYANERKIDISNLV